ncbi:capsular polysaccharide biosynthesis protein CapC [Synergistales bacterium]|nr:capsular polysaccharide biosynthesis protein CapC [Synergistales bacterium]
MDYAGTVSLTLAVGVAVGLVYYRRTGWSPGGLVTPGLLALSASDPVSFLGALLLGLAFAVVLRCLVSKMCLYGRERVGAALLMAILFRLVFRSVMPALFIDSLWIGWAAPGLIAADAERQGALMTVTGATSTGIATALVMFIVTALRQF